MFILLHIILVMNVRGDPICPWGKYGDACDKNCSEHCRRSPSLGIIHCDRTSGYCSEGCIPGWYDATCNKECNTKCINNICNHGDGACTRGCKDGEKGNFCEREEHERKVNDSTPGPLLWKILVPVCVCLFLLLVLMYQYRRVCLRRCENSVERNEYMAVREEGTWHVSRDITGLLKRPNLDTPLHKASADGNLDRAKEIMNEGLLNANSRGLYGLTPLMLAAFNGHYGVFEYLKQEGGDMTLKDRDGDHILSMACVGGNMDIVKDVVLHEPTLINRKRSDGRTALMWAAWHGKKTVFKYLLDRKATLLLDDNDGDNILHYACHGGHIDIVKYVIDKTTLNSNSRDLLGRTALMIAATYGYKEVFDLLVGKGSDISQKDKQGNNMLHVACQGGHEQMVERFLSQGDFDINCRGQNGKTPLLFAAFGGHRGVFDLLVRKKAALAHVDNKRNNSLHVACIGGHKDMVKHILIQGMGDINSKGEDGMTPLMLAARCGHKAVFDLLVKEKANASTVESKGNNILHVACIGGDVEIVKNILSRDMADINCQGEDGRTPLMLAVLKGCRVMFDFLESKGADLLQVDHKRNNVLHLACEIGSLEILQHVVSKNSLDINAKNSQGETATMVAKRKHHMDLHEWLVSQRGHVLSKSYLQALKRITCTRVEV